MAVKIRLRRMGRKKRPIWGVVASDVRFPRDGRFIEDLGRYYPLEEPARVVLQEERVRYWLQVGAQPTDTVRSLLSREGILLGLHLQRKGKSEEEVAAAVAEHRERQHAQAMNRAKLTPAERRAQSLKREGELAAEREAKAAAERQRRMEEKKARAAAKAAQEAEAAAEVEDVVEAEETE